MRESGEPVTKMRRKEYEEELRRLQVELVQMQRWVVEEHAKVCIVFEGRDTAGKGGVIKRLTERVSPRVFRVVALPAPNERERSQMYIQRYIPHLPAGGEVVIFDRSWYNRAGVEPVMGFCTPEESARFLELVPFVEQAIVDSGVILLKYWLEVSQDEQTRRLTARIDDGRKTWKLSQMDLDSYGRWYDYSRARDAMFAATDTETAPWYVANSDDKRRARLNIISHILDLVPYEREKETHVVLPGRQKKGDYREPHHTPTRGAVAVLTRNLRPQLAGLRALRQKDEIAHMHAAGLTPQRDLDVAFGDEHAQALGVAAKGHRRLKFEGLTIDAGVRRARAGPDLELLTAELEGVAATRSLAGQGESDDLGRLCARRCRHGKHAEAPRVESEALGRAGRRGEDVGVIRHHDEKGPVDLGAVGRHE